MVEEWRQITPDAKLVVTTARSTETPRVWHDTYAWLKEQGILPDRLYFTGEGRIAITLDLLAVNKDVVLFDDNPEIHLRTSHNNLQMLVPSRGYNAEIASDPPRVIRTARPRELWNMHPEILPGGDS